MQMISSPPQTPASPTAPAPPAPVAATPAVAGTAAPQAAPRALSAQEVAMLRARRTELSNQLQSADSRRHRLSNELNGAEAAADRSGLEQRIAVLDKRIVQLESDIAETGRQLTMAPAGLVTSTAEPRSFAGLEPDAVTAISMTFTILVLAPMAVAAARLMWKRAVAPSTPAGFTEAARRLGNLEQAVDAIAIEIERVSEGQRFVTRLFSDAQAARPALGVGQPAAEPIRVGLDEAVRVSRQET